jgi:hypothetical protein
MIASSRKKTDKRDAFWLVKALQTGMTLHPGVLNAAEDRCNAAKSSRAAS